MCKHERANVALLHSHTPASLQGQLNPLVLPRTRRAIHASSALRQGLAVSPPLGTELSYQYVVGITGHLQIHEPLQCCTLCPS